MSRVKTWKRLLGVLVVIAILQAVLEGLIGIDAVCKPIREQEFILPQGHYYPDSNSVRFQLVHIFPISLSAMELSDGIVFVMGEYNGYRNALWSMNLVTQEVHWQTCATGVMSVGEDYIYVLDSSSSNTRVRAYDMNSGTEVWQKGSDFGFPAVKNLEITPLGLLVTTHNHGIKRWNLRNLQTGRKEHTFQNDSDVKGFWIEQGSVIYDVKDADLVVANGPIQWQTQVGFESYIDSELVALVAKREFVLVYEQSPTITQIAVLNKYNGDILWQANMRIASNLVVSEGTLFFVTSDVELLAIDLQTGEISGSITFFSDLGNPLNEYLDILVSANKDQALVYFANSNQLFNFYYSSNE